MGIVVRIRGGKTRLTTLKHAHRSVVIGAGVYLVAVFGYCAYNYATTRAEVRKELDHRLMVGARATLLLADEHVSRPNPLEVMGESAYMAMLLRMNAYIEEANLDFIYTMAEEDGVIYFTASTFPRKMPRKKLHALRVCGRESRAQRMPRKRRDHLRGLHRQRRLLSLGVHTGEKRGRRRFQGAENANPTRPPVLMSSSRWLMRPARRNGPFMARN